MGRTVEALSEAETYWDRYYTDLPPRLANEWLQAFSYDEPDDDTTDFDDWFDPPVAPPGQAAAEPVPLQTGDLVAQLARLSTLRDTGALTHEEFALAKAKLLS